MTDLDLEQVVWKVEEDTMMAMELVEVVMTMATVTEEVQVADMTTETGVTGAMMTEVEVDTMIEITTVVATIGEVQSLTDSQEQVTMIEEETEIATVDTEQVDIN